MVQKIGEALFCKLKDQRESRWFASSLESINTEGASGLMSPESETSL